MKRTLTSPACALILASAFVITPSSQALASDSETQLKRLVELNPGTTMAEMRESATAEAARTGEGLEAVLRRALVAAEKNAPSGGGDGYSGCSGWKGLTESRSIGDLSTPVPPATATPTATWGSTT